MRFDIIADTREAVEDLLATASRAEDLSDAQELLLGVLRDASARQFATGAGWAHSEKAGQTLVLTGNLRDSLTRAGGDSRVTIRGEEIVLESGVDYGEYLAGGARGMPRRDPSDIDEWQTERDAALVFADYVVGR